MQQYELHVYDEDGRRISTEFHRLRSEAAARAKAGRVSKANKGPVDLAHAGSAEWADRYLTTASPSEVHAAGYRFERLT